MSAQVYEILISKITIPVWCERPPDAVADHRDRESIRATGVQQPVVLVPDGERMILADGLRRIRISKSLDMSRIPYVEILPPKGEDPEAYARELRLSLDVHRQDFTPSQKCEIVRILKERFGFKTNKEIAAHLVVDQDTITNWLAVKDYIPEVVQMLDSDRLSVRAARTFQGMTEKGQRTVWEKEKETLLGGGRTNIHKAMRAKYPPEKYPTFYLNPKTAKERLARPTKKRASHGRPLTAEHKRRLMSSLDIKSIELRQGEKDKKRLEREIMAASVPINAIVRNPELLALAEKLLPGCKEEFERFVEVY